MLETSINIKCPTCKTEKLISFPNHLVKLTQRMTPVRIDKGLCCEHAFVVFLSKNMTQIGAEKADVSLDVGKDVKIHQKITFSDFIAYYGLNNTAYSLKALMFEVPIVFLERKDFIMNYFGLNTFFRTFLPDNYMRLFPVSSVQQSDLKGVDLGNVLQCDIISLRLSCPWKELKKSHKFVMGLIEEVLKISDEKNRATLLHEKLVSLNSKAEYIDNFITTNRSGRIELLNAGFKKAFGKSWDRGEFDLLKEICQTKFKTPIENLTSQYA